MLRFLPRLPVRERSVGPPMGDSRGSLGHRLYERELLFVDAHAKPWPIVWPHLAVPALEEFGHVWHRALALVVLHQDLTGERHHRVHVAGRRDRAAEVRDDADLVGVAHGHDLE